MEKRSGKERRKHIDPRYRNAAYPEFVDRREVDRGKPPYEHIPALIREQPRSEVASFDWGFDRRFLDLYLLLYEFDSM
jgi:hypothetical protein